MRTYMINNAHVLKCLEHECFKFEAGSAEQTVGHFAKVFVVWLCYFRSVFGRVVGSMERAALHGHIWPGQSAPLN